jgi:hypothetical protein
MFPAEWARRHARERLGIEPDEIDGGHYVTLSRPCELAERLAAYAAGTREEISPTARHTSGSRVNSRRRRWREQSPRSNMRSIAPVSRRHRLTRRSE